MKYAIITDFDGTLTQIDVAHLLVAHFRADGVSCEPVHKHDDAAKAWMRRYMGSIKASKEEFEAFVLSAARPRAGMMDMLHTAFERNVPVEIVSGGLDIYINPFLAAHGISGLPVYSANAQFTPEGIKVDYPLLENFLLADFKAARVKHYKAQGYTTIFCGDGMTDLTAAKEADILFARDLLLDECVRQKIPAQELISFNDVIEIIR